MRVLILDHYYPSFARYWYESHPGLEAASYDDQRRSFGTALFGGTEFEVNALRALGHEASAAIINVRPTQEAWSREHGIRLPSDQRLQVRRRRGVVPWIDRVAHDSWISAALLAQVEEFKPDVVHVQCMDSIDVGVLPKIHALARLVVGQIAAPLPMARALAGYDLVVSSLPNFVKRFREAGLDSEWLPLAFEPAVLDALGPVERSVPVSFVGSLFNSHGVRVRLLEQVASRVPVDIWTSDVAALAPDSPLRARLHDSAWGIEMYRALGESRITINVHIDVAEDFANNLRLYEATGMGALLITDSKVNLGNLFDIGNEVVAYSDAASCIRTVRHYIEHPDEAARIAAAGQARTLRDHTWRARMRELVNMMESRLP
jgi:spore maturation protein CgeB